MDINQLVNITSRAWSLQILALMHDGTAGRQAALLAATGAGRTAFGHSLNHLIGLDLLERNPGHGHPLRPEYRLTAKGQHIAKIAARVLNTNLDATDHSLLRRTWTLPILTLSQTPLRFSDFKQKLPAISDRALSQSLQTLENRSWMIRQIDPQDRPLRPLYTATGNGALISRAARPIAA